MSGTDLMILRFLKIYLHEWVHILYLTALVKWDLFNSCNDLDLQIEHQIKQFIQIWQQFPT